MLMATSTRATSFDINRVALKHEINNSGNDMIEVSNIKQINKGTLLASCDVRIAPWKMTLKEVKIFEKGTQRWIGLPSREYLENDEKKYIELISFDNNDIKTRFRDQIMKEINLFLQRNPEMKPDDVIQDGDLPF